MKVSEPPVIVEQSFDSKVQDLWNALTDVEEMTQWYFDNIPAFEPKVGFQTRFPVTSKDRMFMHLWTVTEVIPYKLLTYNWKYENYPGDSFVTFELFEESSQKSKLRVVAKVVEDFPDDIPEFKWESCKAGWTYFINERLKAYLG